MEKDLQRTKKYDKDMIKLIAYKSIEFPVETKNQININVFVYENKQVHPVHLSENRFDVHMELLLLIYEQISHHFYIKNYNRFMHYLNKAS